jgi:hypothetical protein
MILIIAGLIVSIVDSVLLPRAPVNSEESRDEEPFLTLAVKLPPGANTSDIQPEIELRLLDRNTIRGTFDVFYSNPDVYASDALRFAVVGPTTMTVTDRFGCERPDVKEREDAVSIEFSSGNCFVNRQDGFDFNISKGTKDVPGGTIHVAPSRRVGLARHRFAVAMKVFGYRGEREGYVSGTGFKAVDNYKLKFTLGEGSFFDFALLTPEPTFTEEYSRSWEVNQKLATRPDADFFSATVIDTAWDSVINWIANLAFVGIGFFLGSIELKRRKEARE